MRVPSRYQAALPESDRMHYSWRLACGTAAAKKNNAFEPGRPNIQHSWPNFPNAAVIAGRGLIARLGAAAIDETDSEEIKLRKTLLMFASGLMNMAAILWLLIYWWMGLKLPDLRFRWVSRSSPPLVLADLPAHPQFRFLPRRAAVAVPVLSVHHPVVDRQLREFLRASRCWRCWRRWAPWSATARASRSPGLSPMSC